MSSFFKKNNSIARRDEQDVRPALRGKAAPMPSPFVNEGPLPPAERPSRALGNPFSKPASMTREGDRPVRRTGEYTIPCYECGRPVEVRDRQTPRIPDVPPHLVDEHVFFAGRATCDCIDGGVIMQIVVGKVVSG